MAKEQCALCGKMVGGLNKMTLGDGNVICTDCWTRGKFGIGVKPKQFTLEKIIDHLSNDPKVLAAEEKRTQRDMQRQERQEEKAEASQAKQERRIEKALDKLGLNLDNYDDIELREKNKSEVQQIAGTLAGSKWYSAGSFLQFNASELFQTEMSRVQIAQNSILIRQNEEIIRLLHRLTDDKLLP